MTPLDAYQTALIEHDYAPDPAQVEAAKRLDEVFHELVNWSPSPAGLMARLLGKETTIDPVQGLYLWGGVGRGKTFLMDLFFDNLPFQKKLRLHFHRFMQLVHEELQAAGERKDPMKEVGRKFAERAQVICLDEMHIKDITDAMIMAGLLESLFERGVCLVTTSNIEPDGLYKNGLQRDRFLPAIELIKKNTDTLELVSPNDYRLRALEQAEVYHHPLDERAGVLLEEAYQNIQTVDHPKPNYITINKREIPVVKWTDGVVWFDFDVICDIPRSQLDHVDIAQIFHTVIVQNVRVMTDAHNDLARRFTTMIDALYDQRVKLLISAEAPAHELYQGTDLKFDFERVTSRLIEMQSHDYLAQPHLHD
ncbi:MAG: cell division protein ZapE [Gammaproteobacteria bacterium]